MPSDATNAGQVEQLLAMPDLAGALRSEPFKRFLDQVPIAIAASEIGGSEQIVYANPEFERLSGQAAAQLEAKDWSVLAGEGVGKQSGQPLASAIVKQEDFVGTFKTKGSSQDGAIVAAYSNVIVNDDGKPCFRLVALVDVATHADSEVQALEDRVREKDTLLLELQHRVKNNLQMITALIRLESRKAAAGDQETFDRLAGRVDSLAILYRTLADDGHKEEIDLGIYLSQIASAVMKSHAVEGIRLNMKVDAYPVSVNVALPTGLVVNELLTNALRHAFKGREGGTITLHSLVDGTGCRVVVADDGVGLPPGEVWPKPGKLGALIARSLKENAKAEFEVETSPETGTRVTIVFKRAAAQSP